MIIKSRFGYGNLPVAKKVGERIRKFRQLAGLNQEYVAEEIGMSGGNFGKIERGEIDINTDYLYKLSKLFKIPVSEFFEESPVSIVSERAESYGYATKDDLQKLSKTVTKLAAELEKLNQNLPTKAEKKPYKKTGKLKRKS